MTAVRPEDLLRFRLPSFQRKLARARAVIAESLATIHRPYVAFSGGKDASVTLALVREQAPDVTVIWSDDELEYPEQEPYILGLAERWNLALRVTLGFARHADWFDPWDHEPYWREPLARAERIGQRIETWAPGAGFDGCFLGLRAAERPHRALHLRARGLLCHTVLGWRSNPLGWWTVDEVWAAIAGLALPYNPVYDRLTGIGVPREQQRVGPLPLSPGWILRTGWPDMCRRLVDRYGERW